MFTVRIWNKFNERGKIIERWFTLHLFGKIPLFKYVRKIGQEKDEYETLGNLSTNTDEFGEAYPNPISQGF